MSVIPTVGDNVFLRLELILPVKNPALIRIGNILIDGLQVMSDSDHSNASEKEGPNQSL